MSPFILLESAPSSMLGNIIVVSGAFLILLVLIKKYAWGAMTSMLDARAKKINDDRDFFRMFFFEYFSKMENNIVNWLEYKFGKLKFKESPFETYLHLLKKQRTHHVLPSMNTCPECKKKGFLLCLKRLEI